MKKNVFFAVIFLFVGLFVYGQSSDDFVVTQNSDGRTLTISGYNGSLKKVTIPATLYDLPVTVIGKEAFYRKGLTSIVIPEGVITIDGDSGGAWGAFYGNQLTTVTIPDSVTTIGNNAFSGNRLTSVVIGNGVTIIGNNAFSNNQLTSLIIGKSVITIGVGAFYKNQLTNVTIPDSVTTIKAGAFGDNRLTSLIIGKSVITIEGGATSNIGEKGPQFQGAFSNNMLSHVIIPDSVTTIGGSDGWDGGAFYGNPLTSLALGRGLEFIGEEAFYRNQLTSIIIAKDVAYKSNRTPGIGTRAGFEEGFINFYESQNRTPGTYVKNGPIWSKR